MLLIIINNELKNTVRIIVLKTVLWLICAKIEVFAKIFAKTIMVNCTICNSEVPLESTHIAATDPRQLCPITAIVAQPI